jgi:hypothetical protein
MANITRTLYKFFDTLPETDISGWRLFEEMHEMTGKNTYPSTLIQMSRDYADITGSDFTCIDRQKSIYHFKPSGFTIGNTQICGKE